MSNCCEPSRPLDPHKDSDSCPPKGRIDWLLYGSLGLIAVGIVLHFLPVHIPFFSMFGHAATELMSIMWWGIVLGIIAVGVMHHVPKEYFNAMLGRGDTFGGLIRAAVAGLVLDLCSHGVLMIGAKLYERGASLAQVMTFLIATPWNSLTVTLILIALIGWQWTLIFIAGSLLIAIMTGMIYQLLVKRGVLPSNPHSFDLPTDFEIIPDAKRRLKAFRPSRAWTKSVLVHGWTDGRMVMRWLFFGTVLAALIRAFVPDEIMADYFGPTMMGLMLTLIATTIIEVCSEGSTPIGAELVVRAGAPGNGFTFLMAGVATDYTEIMVTREFSKSWRAALFLPLVTVPQVILLGWLMNQTVL